MSVSGLKQEAKRMRGQPVIFLSVIILVWTGARVTSLWPESYDEEKTDSSMTASRAPADSNLDLAKTDASTFYSGDVRTDIQVPSYLPYFAVRGTQRTAVPAKKNMSLLMRYSPITSQVGAGKDKSTFSEYYDATETSDTVFNANPMVSRTDTNAVKPSGARDPDVNRWSLSSWIFVRPGGTDILTAGQGQYGGSQAGAVLRYNLAPASAHRPELYVRLSAPLGGNGRAAFDDTEIAAGVMARPIRQIPVAVAAEQRVSLGNGGRTRPALYAVTQIPPVKLPLGFTGDFYGQAGIVGVQDSQAFFDLQAKAARPLLSVGRAEVSTGGGIWTGGQSEQGRDTARLDIGPVISANIPVPDGNARLSVSYRQRIAGNAAPDSGVAVTLSSDF